MWLLSCNGDLLQGKKLWLRPGSSHLLGRTSSKLADNGERVRYIDHRSVSRKHLILSVSDVQLGDSSRIFSRSRIVATDGSRSGSTIDGVSLKQASKTLDGKGEHTIQLGSLSTLFKLEWRPVVLSFNVSKSARTKGTALDKERQKLEGADIKLSVDYLSGSTTHAVTKKRNVPSALQALLQAKWLVTDSFVNALADKCRRRGGDGGNDPGSSPLEDDFEYNWPDEMDFLVPAAGEPVPRPNEYLKPDTVRETLFSDLTFVFLSQDQLDLLLPVITAGSGKAVLCEYAAERTTVDDVVDFVKQLVGKKRAGRFLLSQEPGSGGVVIVRISEKAGGRSDDFLSDLSIALDQRTIEQSELLDAILTKNVKSFRRPLQNKTQSATDTQIENYPAPSSSIARPPVSSLNGPETLHVRNTVTISDSPPVESQRIRTRHEPADPQSQAGTSRHPIDRQPYKRTTTARTNITFNDDFDPSQAIPDDSSDEDEQPIQRHVVQEMHGIEASQQQTISTQKGSRKRPAPDDEEQDDEEATQRRNERLMPALAKAKRRRTEAEAKREKSAVDPTLDLERAKPAKIQDAKKAETANERGKTTKKRGRKVSESELELKEKMRAYREAEEEERRRDEEDLQRDFDINDVKIVVAEFDVPIRPRDETASQTHRMGRLEWRDRQNFKGFRSNKNKESNRPIELEAQPVLVALDPVPGKSDGLGDDYWLEKSKKRGTQSQSQSQSQHRQSGSAIATANGTVQLDDAENEDDEFAFRRRLNRSREEDAAADADAHGSFDAPSQTMRPVSQRKITGKRPAAQAGLDLAAVGAPATKKPRQTGRRAFLGQEENDSDEDDPLAFRRTRR